MKKVLSFEGLLSFFNSIGTLWIFVLMIVINIDVIGRTAYDSPLPGVLELVRLSIVGIIFIQLGHTLRAGRITRADAPIKAMQRRWPRLGFGLQALYSVGGIFVFAVLFYASYPLFIQSWTGGEYEGIEGYITFPVWPVRLIILIGSACMVGQFLIMLWRDGRIALGLREPEIEEAVETGESAYGSGD